MGIKTKYKKGMTGTINHTKVTIVEITGKTITVEDSKGKRRSYPVVVMDRFFFIQKEGNK